MQYIGDEIKGVLAHRLKAGKRRPVVRVEVDKLTYSPLAYSEVDVIRYLTDGRVPVTSAGAGTANITSALSLVFPIQDSILTEGSITSTFGMRQLDGEPYPSMHNGIDLAYAARIGIVAVADGEVVYVGRTGAAGNSVEILHANGYRTRYLHLYDDSITVAVGDKVKQGQKVGEEGSTGYSTGYHLHFEIRTGASKSADGKPVDPLPYLKGEKGFGTVNVETAAGTATVIEPLNLRDNPNAAATVLQVLATGVQVTLLAKTGEWYKVDAGGTVGYAYERYLSVYSSPDTKKYGAVIGSAVNVMSTPSNGGSVLKIVNSGQMMEYTDLVDGWYKVVLDSATQGYIRASSFKADGQALLHDYIVDRVLYDNFEGSVLYSAPSRFRQTGADRWLIQNDGASNVLCIKDGVFGSSTAEFTVMVQNAGRLDLRWATRLIEGNWFNVYVDEEKVLAASEYPDGYVYHDLSVPLLGGSHTIKLERWKGTLGEPGTDMILVDELSVYQYLYPSKPVSSSADIVDVTSATIDRAIISADSANIRVAPDGEIVGTANRGETYVVTAIENGWYRIVHNGSPAYINSSYADFVSNATKDTLLVRTGGFLYDKTLVLDNVVSVDVDYKFEMRAGEASVTVSNENGFYSPDYSPMNFPMKGLRKSPFVEYHDGAPVGVLSENTPIRIYLGYGDFMIRRFTGLIDVVDMDGESKTLTLKCSDMMKKLNNYFTYMEIKYPPEDTQVGYAWLTSSVIHDLASRGGMSNWRVAADDLHYNDIEVEETYYTDIQPQDGLYMKIMPDGSIDRVPMYGVPDDGGWRNPHAIMNKVVPPGTCIADEIDNLCQQIDFWQRCDRFGTYKVSPTQYTEAVVASFKDTDNLVSLSKTIDTTRTRNHLIIRGGAEENHFFDWELWRDVKGERRTAAVSVPWADTYGKQKIVADKIFSDMKRSCRTIQACIEGNPYLDLLDTVAVDSSDTTTKGQFHIKGIRDSFTDGQGYLTFLDLYWTGVGR